MQSISDDNVEKLNLNKRLLFRIAWSFYYIQDWTFATIYFCRMLCYERSARTSRKI